MRIFAYLDAGTGSVIIQAVIGSLLAIGVLVRAFWSKITSFFGKLNPSNSSKEKTTDTTKTVTKSGKSS